MSDSLHKELDVERGGLTMKTVQEHLREANRARLLDSLAYDELCDPITLLECKDMTIREIQNACKKQMNEFIDHLLSMKAVTTDNMVLYMVPASAIDRHFNHEFCSVCLVDLNEIRKDIYAASYAFELTEWDKTLGYLVADNKLTQDHMNDLLTQYLHEISFFGTDPEKHEKKTEKVYAELDQSMKNLDVEKCTPADEFFDELAREYGWPIDEKDEKQDDLHGMIMEAEIRFSRYCNWRERSRILESLGEKAPYFKEDMD